MDRIKVNSELLQSAGRKIGKSADQMDDGLHDLHRVIEMLEEYGDGDIIEKCVRELERYEKKYKRLQAQALSLGRAIGKVADSFEKREAATVKLGNSLNMASKYTINWLGTDSAVPFRWVMPGKTRYMDFRKNLTEALKVLPVQSFWINPFIFIPEWLRKAADEYENNRQV